MTIHTPEGIVIWRDTSADSGDTVRGAAAPGGAASFCAAERRGQYDGDRQETL